MSYGAIKGTFFEIMHDIASQKEYGAFCVVVGNLVVRGQARGEGP